MGEKLGKFEVEKRQAVESEDYDKAKQKKLQMDEYRKQVYEQLQISQILDVSKVWQHLKTSPFIVIYFMYGLISLLFIQQTNRTNYW